MRIDPLRVGVIVSLSAMTMPCIMVVMIVMIGTPRPQDGKGFYRSEGQQALLSRQNPERSLKEVFKRRSDPHDQIGPVDRTRVRRAQRKAVRATGGVWRRPRLSRQ